MPGSKSNAAYEILFGAAAGTKITGTDTSRYLGLAVPALPLVNRVTQNLGTIAYTDMPDPSADAQGYWYRFTAAHTGTLTVQATPQDNGAVSDHIPKLQSSDYLDPGFRERQAVADRSTDHCRPDLLSRSHGDVHGLRSPPGRPGFCQSRDRHRLRCEYPGNGRFCHRNAGSYGERDRLCVHSHVTGDAEFHGWWNRVPRRRHFDVLRFDTLVMNEVGSAVKAGSATLSGTAGGANYTVNIRNSGSITVQGGGTAEKARLYGVKGNNTLIASPGQVDFSGAGYHDHGAGFTTISVSGAAGGKQAASITGSASGKDTFTLTPRTANVSFAQGQNLTVQAFDHIYSIAGNASDSADLTLPPATKTLLRKPTFPQAFRPDRRALGALMSDSATYWNWLEGFSTVSIDNPSTKPGTQPTFLPAGQSLGDPPRDNWSLDPVKTAPWALVAATNALRVTIRTCGLYQHLVRTAEFAGIGGDRALRRADHLRSATRRQANSDNARWATARYETCSHDRGNI